MGWVREPLVHFLLGGAALFAVYALIGDSEAERPDRVVINADRVANIASTFERTWMRRPTQAELDGLIDDYILEEVLYREALALGLDRDDLVVRRRMRQKMEFLNEGLGEREPETGELEAFLAENPDRFRQPARRSFEQIFLDPERSEPARVRALLETARAASDATAWRQLGDATLLPGSSAQATATDVSGSFGSEFAAELFEVQGDGWQGPIDSSFGRHLVRVTERWPERLPQLDEVRPAVSREWSSDRRDAARKSFYSDIRARYDIEVQMPADADTLAAARE